MDRSIALGAITFSAALAITSCGSKTGLLADTVVEFRTDDEVDLLVVIDNSDSMRENQANLLRGFTSMMSAFDAPSCTSAINPTPHTCNPADPADRTTQSAVVDLHVGIVSSDLGTANIAVPGCADSNIGDDGLLNPIRNGLSLLHHEPWASATPIPGRPTDCVDPDQFPSFLTYVSRDSDPATFLHDVRCNAGLGVGGCSLPSQLDAAYRAIIWHDATETPGNTSPNAHFLREDAILAILVLTDQEDGSVRDHRFADGAPVGNSDAIDVYNAASLAWASRDLGLRFDLYQPCAPQDPTWGIDRYIDPVHPGAGLLGLKPDHPERVVFAAIAGVPIHIPRRADGATDWDQLLGVPRGGADDFCGRDSTSLGEIPSAEGPVSMQQANLDPACPQRVVPACRREGTVAPPAACAASQQYFAEPSRRIVEVARRFDEAPICGGAPCHNGIISSVCSTDYATAIQQIVARVQARRIERCIPHSLRVIDDDHECSVQQILAAGEDRCDASRALHDVMVGGTPTPSYVLRGGERRRICNVDRVAVGARTGLPVAGTNGWFYESHPSDSICEQRLSFTSEATPEHGWITRLQCR